MNKLKNEKSPYLLQHADNPVKWYPWGKEAFNNATLENKPVFLSIGYSTCHWCHVMAHESFEDQEVAGLMNDVFISIKVDREERPDIDNVYMTVCQMMTGTGGWPLTIIITPGKKPFFAGTYFPKNSRFGRMGLIDLINRVKELWNSQKEEILVSADQISRALQEIAPEIPGDKLNEEILKKTFDLLKARYDEKNGGFGGRPKFPTPHNLSFLLRFWKRTGDDVALEIVEKTLKAMRRGGIYDHVGFGIHRYSTDSTWLVPHFEKMLYDQALVALACVDTYQATKNDEYREFAQEIFTYILRDMTSPEGGFFSAEDADSEGVEGKFYLWTKDEIEKIFDKELAELAIYVFNVQDGGNYLEESTRVHTGHNILHLNNSIDKIAERLKLPEQELRLKIDKIREILYNTRKKRIHPHKDDKSLTDWNGIMIAALAKGGRIFQDKTYINAAEKAFNFINSSLSREDGKLLHRYREGKAGIDAFLTDYSFLIWGLIELYEATFNVAYIKRALDFLKIQDDDFWDETAGGYFFTSNENEELFTRQKEIYDGAIPSGNSIALLNLLRLSQITGDHELEEKADVLNRVFSEKVQINPDAYTQLMVGVDFAIGPSYSVVIAGKTNYPDTLKMIEVLNNHFIPNKVLIQRKMEQDPPDIDNFSNFLQYFKDEGGKATAYVCINKTCKPATQDAEKLIEYLKTEG